ncbi:MAG: transporter, partial [Novipirellula sp. JB048]
MARLLLVGAALVNLFNDTAEAQSPSLIDWSGCETLACDADGCDAATFGRFGAIPPAHQRGTVGSLFRWGGHPHAGELPQPDDPLVADRPDFTEASSVVGLGVLQIESGYTYTYDSEGGERLIRHNYPETLFRYGVLANWLEFRLAFSYTDEDVNGAAVHGADDIYLGFKIGLTPQVGLLPEMAILPQMTVPSGSHDLSEGTVRAGLNWLYSWELNDFVEVAGSTQFNQTGDGVTLDTYTEWAQSAAVGYALSDRLGAYA